MCVIAGGPSDVDNTIIYTGPITDMGRSIPHLYFTAYSFDTKDYVNNDGDLRFMLLHFPAEYVGFVDTSEYKNFLKNMEVNTNQATRSVRSKSIDFAKVGIYNVYYGRDITELFVTLQNTYGGNFNIDENFIGFYNTHYPNWMLMGIVWNGSDEKKKFHPFALEWKMNSNLLPEKYTKGDYLYYPAVDNSLKGDLHSGGIPDLNRHIQRNHILFTGLSLDDIMYLNVIDKEIYVKYIKHDHNVPLNLVTNHVLRFDINYITQNGDIFVNKNSIDYEIYVSDYGYNI